MMGIVLGVFLALAAQDSDRTVRLTYQVLYASDEEKLDERKRPQAIVDVLQRRIARRGLKEARFRVEGQDRIVAEVPAADVAAYKELFKRIGKLDLRPGAPAEVEERWRADPETEKSPQSTAPSGYEAMEQDGKFVLVSAISVITGAEIRSAVATLDTLGNRWRIDFVLTEEGAKRFDEAAKELFGREPRGTLAIVLDAAIQSMPVVNSEKFGGAGQITGSFTEKEAKDLAAVLQGGCLPVALGSFDGVRRRVGEPEKEESVGGFAIPATTTGKDGWEVYEKPIVLSKDGVKDLAPGQESPEAAVVHFYASRIRGDARYEEVLPPKDQWTDVLKHKLQEMGEWTFVEVRLLSRKKKTEDEMQLRLFLKIRCKGKEDEGEDQIKVQKIGGKWCVTRPPT